MMFERLSDNLGKALNRLSGRGTLSEADIAATMREVRLALLEADVSLGVVKSFIRSTQKKAKGVAVTRSITPGNQVIKIVHDELVSILAGQDQESETLCVDNPPAPVLMVGLQGSGKTTTTAKIGKHLSKKFDKRVLMASLDTSRPAAMQQLEILGKQANVETLPIVPGESAVDIARRARSHAQTNGFDVYLLDTAGRLHIDRALMTEVAQVRDITAPRETLLIVDGLTGQDAVNVAEEFERKVGISGVILTRMDGDGRGGAALSMRAITGKPIKFIGTGEKLDDLGVFNPERIAGRILGMGDIVALVEQAGEVLEAEKAKRMLVRIEKGRFNLNDLRQYLETLEKMGGANSVFNLMPGFRQQRARLGNMKDLDKITSLCMAVTNSMTKLERLNPHLLQASRKRRVAAGAGVQVSDVNKVLKLYKQFAGTWKKLSRGGNSALLQQFLSGAKAGGTGEMTPEQLRGAQLPDKMLQKAMKEQRLQNLASLRFRR